MTIISGTVDLQIRDIRATRPFSFGIAAGGIGVMRNTKGHHRADPGVGDAFDLLRQIFFRNARITPGIALESTVIINFFFNKRSATPGSFKLSVVSSNRARSAAD